MGKGIAPGETGFKIVPIFENEAVPYLTKDYLSRLEDCIRQRTPVAGSGINIKIVQGSYNISVVSGVGSGGGGGEPLVLTVCSNGQPTVVTVVRYSG